MKNGIKNIINKKTGIVILFAIGVILTILSYWFEVLMFPGGMALFGTWLVYSDLDKPIKANGYIIRVEKPDGGHFYMGTNDSVQSQLISAIIFNNEEDANTEVKRINNIYGRTTDIHLNNPENLDVKEIKLTIN